MDRRTESRGPTTPSNDRFLAKPQDARFLVMARLGANLTQQAAAEACGVTSQHISDIECGRSRPGRALLDRLYVLYGIEP